LPRGRQRLHLKIATTKRSIIDNRSSLQPQHILSCQSLLPTQHRHRFFFFPFSEVKQTFHACHRKFLSQKKKQRKKVYETEDSDENDRLTTPRRRRSGLRRHVRQEKKCTLSGRRRRRRNPRPRVERSLHRESRSMFHPTLQPFIINS
jgi:hypothetical protein